jgi:hypothetical protein
VRCPSGIMARPEKTERPFLPLAAGLCAWLFPGAGHWLIGERKRALVIAVSVTALFVAGLYIGSTAVIDPMHDPISYVTQVPVSPVVFYLNHLNKQLGDGTPVGRALVFGRPNEIGQIYTSVAGLLNLLCIFSAILMADAQQRQKKGE